MKKSVLIIATISILLNIGLIYMFVLKGATVESNDNRVAIEMTENNRAFVLAEMRDFLESVKEINEGILNNNPELVIKAGEKSGGSVIAHAPKGLMKTLPVGFKQLGFATHDIFDEIAKKAKENYQPKETQQQLNALLNNCTACHQAFKIQGVVQ